MKEKQKILAKIFLVLLSIILVFATIMLISYETAYKRNTVLIDNGNILPEEGTIINTEIEKTSNNIFIQIKEKLIPTNPEEDEDSDEEEINNENNQEIEQGELTFNIAPIINNNINGIVIIEILSYPDLSEEILVMISPENSEDPINDENTVLDFLEVSINQEFVFDSADLINGNYILTVAATYDDAPEQDPWLEVIKQDIIIEN